MLLLEIISVWIAGAVACTFLFGRSSPEDTFGPVIVIAAAFWPVTLPIWIVGRFWPKS